MKKGVVLTVKIIFPIILVIIFFFIFINLTTSRAQKNKMVSDFDYYTRLNTFMKIFMSTPSCGALGRISNETGNQAPIRAIFEVDKLNIYDRTNKDPGCIQNFDFIYTVEIEDLKNKKTWIIGPINTDPEWAEREISTSFPCVIKYSNGITDSGLLKLYAYIGGIPDLYTAIKKVCMTNEDETVVLNSLYDIKYSSSSNQFSVGTDYFHPSFPCRVGDFSINRGKHILYINYMDGGVKIQ